MKKTFLLLALYLGLSSIAMAQTASKLETAVKKYNALRDFKVVPETKLSDVLQLADESEYLLRQVITNGTEEEQKTARYFLAVLTHKRGEFYFRENFLDRAKGASILRSVESEYDRLNESEFPFRYVYDTKNFIVKYVDFVNTRQVYYAEMAEIVYTEKNYSAVRNYAAKIEALPTSDNEFYIYLTHYFLYRINTGQEKLRSARRMYELYANMSNSYREDINQQNAGTKELTNIGNFLLARQGDAAGWDNSGTECAGIAANLRKSGDLGELACRFYDAALDRNYNFSNDQLWDILQYFDTQNYNKPSCLKICTRLMTRTSSTDCAGLERLAPYFAKYGDAARSQSLLASAQNCRAEAQKRADEEARRRHKAEKKASRQRVYVGAYILRMIQRPEYIDLGGTLDIPVGKNRIEFSYMKARNDQDYMLAERFGDVDGVNDIDNPHWDGFYAHFGFKGIKNSYSSKSKGYFGFLLNYNERNFRPIISNVNDAATGLSVDNNVPFRPTLTAYGAMLNFGNMALGKGLGIDMYMGLGATYNQFDLNNSTYTRETHTFDHPLLNGRKETFWGFQMRLGITVGLSL